MAQEFKIVVVGAGGVGKSGLTLQFCAGKCPKRYDPTIEDSYRKTAEVDGKACTLDILDTAGQEEYASLRSEYMSEGKGFVLVYSITAEDSFHEMDTFFDQIETNKGGGDKVPIALVGNKVDLDGERKVTYRQGEEKQRQWIERAKTSSKIGDVQFYETSAMMNINVTELFKGLVRVMMEKSPGGGAAPVVASAAPPAQEEPKTSGDKGGGCKCVVQ